MVYNLNRMKNIIIVSVISLLFFIGCSNEKDNKIENTFYIELVNFTFDSLRTSIENNIFGKVTFYRDGKLEIVSENYVTENLPETHNFYNAAGLQNKIKEGTKKIRIEFSGDFSYDTVAYSLQKYKFSKKQWVKTSDMGVLKSFTRMVDPEYQIKDLGKKIIINTVEYSYN